MKRWIVGMSIGVSVLAGCVITQQTPPANPTTLQMTATDLVLPILATNTRIPTATPEASGLPPIVFESNRDGSYELYGMYPDGSGLESLTESDNSAGIANGSPSWSPDGQQIAYSSRRDNDWDIQLLSADGSSSTNLTQIEGEDDKASWSPDGTRLVFNSRRNEARWADIWLMNGDGSSPINLSSHPDDDREPSWSPNGMEIVFRSFRDGNYEIYVMDVASHAARQLTQTEADPAIWNGSPVWSPDGKWIAFETDRDGDWNLYVMDNNGHQLRNLTPDDEDDKNPEWSPDGRFIAFSSTRDGNAEIYVLEIATGAVERLTYDCGGDFNPTWRGTGNTTASGEPTRQAIAYVASGTPNLRTGPATTFESVGGAALNECLTIIGRSQDNLWLQVRTSVGRTAWVVQNTLVVQGDLSLIPMTE